MRFVFVVDPLSRLDPTTDTSVGLMLAAQERGVEAWVTEAGRLEFVDGRPRALARPLSLAAFGPAVGAGFLAAPTWYALGPADHIWLNDVGAVFMRTEPPVDQTFVTATLILD